MDYVPPFGGAANDPYVNPNPLLSILGSIVPAAAMEHAQREIVHAIQYAGITPNGATLTQLRSAIDVLVAAGIPAYVGAAPNLQVAASQFISGVMDIARMPPGLIPRNHLINGAMQIWQRNTTFSSVTTEQYTADRWGAVIANSGTGLSVSRQQNSIPGFQWALRAQRPAGSTNTQLRVLCQILTSEETARLAGKTCTVSAYVKGGANFTGAGGQIGPAIRWGTGTDRNLHDFLFVLWPGSTDIGGFSAVAPTPVPYRWSATFTLPSNATQMGLYFAWNPQGTAGAEDYWDITGVLIHPGSVPLPYPHLRFADALAECQRFYTKTFNHGAAPASDTNFFEGALGATGTAATDTDVHVPWRFPVEMRAIPTVTTYNPGSTGSGWRNEADSASYAADVPTTALGKQGCSIGTTTNIPTGERVFIHATAEAEL